MWNKNNENGKHENCIVFLSTFYHKYYISKPIVSNMINEKMLNGKN